MDKFKKSLPMMLHRTLDAVIPRYRAVFKEHGVSEQQWRILRVLWEVKTCNTAELAAATLLPSPSLVGIIDRMIKKELVVRERSSKDRRIVHISLTETGLELQQQLMPQIDDLYKTMMSQCDEDAWQTMMTTLQTIIDTNKTS